MKAQKKMKKGEAAEKEKEVKKTEKERAAELKVASRILSVDKKREQRIALLKRQMAQLAKNQTIGGKSKNKKRLRARVSLNGDKKVQAQLQKQLNRLLIARASTKNKVEGTSLFLSLRGLDDSVTQDTYFGGGTWDVMELRSALQTKQAMEAARAKGTLNTDAVGPTLHAAEPTDFSRGKMNTSKRRRREEDRAEAEARREAQGEADSDATDTDTDTDTGTDEGTDEDSDAKDEDLEVEPAWRPFGNGGQRKPQQEQKRKQEQKRQRQRQRQRDDPPDPDDENLLLPGAPKRATPHNAKGGRTEGTDGARGARDAKDTLGSSGGVIFLCNDTTYTEVY